MFLLETRKKKHGERANLQRQPRHNARACILQRDVIGLVCLSKH